MSLDGWINCEECCPAIPEFERAFLLNNRVWLLFRAVLVQIKNLTSLISPSLSKWLFFPLSIIKN